MSLNIDSYLTTSNGIKIPQLGFGNVPNEYVYDSVEAALKAGYRHFDTAQLYGTESSLAKSLSTLLPKLNIPRSSIFITTKYNPPDPIEEPGETVDEVYNKIQSSKNIFVDDAKLEYIDLLLIHQPRSGPAGRARMWEALKKCKEDGWVKEIGVSNFSIHMLKQLPSPKPTVNQIEFQPWYQQPSLVSYCQSENIVIVAFCPLVRSDPRRMSDPAVVKIAERCKKDVGQVLLRWSLQRGIIPIPASKNPKRITSNADLYDFELSLEEMKALDGLELGGEGACSVKAHAMVNGP